MLRYYADMLAVASLLLIAESAAALTLPEFEAAPPMEAADRALEGLDHGPIAKVEPHDQPGSAPGVTEYRAYEQPVAVPGGCRRGAWSIAFSKRSNAESPATLSNRFVNREVGLAVAGSCEGAAFVHLNPGVDEPSALQLLSQISEIATGTREFEFDCRTQVRDPICDSPDSVREALRSETPFAVSPENGTIELWLSQVRGGIVTKVRFDPARRHRLQVEKEIPAPF
jgi:hypothetical protein